MAALTQIVRRQLTLRTHRIHEMPVVVLMPHSRCNCRCVMCDIWKANRNGQEISTEQLAPHLDDLQRLGVRWVVLSGGEALMHRNLWEFCAPLRALGVRITLLSTGLLLARHATEVVRWCDEVIVSLDGRQPVHDAIRNIPRAYERLAAGVAALHALDPTFRVTARCVLQRLNFRELPGVIDAAHELGLEEISFLAADVSSEAFNRPDPWGDARVAEIALPPDEVREFDRLLEQTLVSHAADVASGFVAESPEKLRAIVRYYGAISGDGALPPVSCNAPWVSTVVEADGTVRPCFFHAPLGNINEQPLGDILNSAEAIAFRRQLDIKTDPICRRCVCTLYIGARSEVG